MNIISLIYYVGFCVHKSCERFGINEEQILDIVLWGAPAGILELGFIMLYLIGMNLEEIY